MSIQISQSTATGLSGLTQVHSLTSIQHWRILFSPATCCIIRCFELCMFKLKCLGDSDVEDSLIWWIMYLYNPSLMNHMHSFFIKCSQEWSAVIRQWTVQRNRNSWAPPRFPKLILQLHTFKPVFPNRFYTPQLHQWDSSTPNQKCAPFYSCSAAFHLIHYIRRTSLQPPTAVINVPKIILI